MAFNLYPNGGGGTTGDEVAVNKPLIVGTTGHVWYVGNAVAGAADAAGRGKEREKPLLTFNQAFTNATSGDVIILLENHAETIAASIAVTKALTIVGEGTGSTRPKLTCAVAGNPMLSLQSAGTSLNNVYFPASTAVPTARVQVINLGIVMDNCYFECGANDTGTTVLYGAVNACQLTNAYFLATGSQPGTAISCPSAMAGFFIEDCTLDGGSFGFSGFAFTAAGVLTAIYANKIHQLNNADVSLAATWTGVWIPGTLSGSARFEG